VPDRTLRSRPDVDGHVRSHASGPSPRIRVKMPSLR
jgi:hypothetical protein